jgi:hypothetical protein
MPTPRQPGSRKTTPKALRSNMRFWNERGRLIWRPRRFDLVVA